MQLKHLNLATSDVGGLALFFERYFGFKRLAARGQDAFALMCNQDEFVLTLMKAKKHDPAAYPETFHVGFCLLLQRSGRCRDRDRHAARTGGRIETRCRNGIARSG